jgi:hypothetical protein
MGWGSLHAGSSRSAAGRDEAVVTQSDKKALSAIGGNAEVACFARYPCPPEFFGPDPACARPRVRRRKYPVITLTAAPRKTRLNTI